MSTWQSTDHRGVYYRTSTKDISYAINIRVPFKKYPIKKTVGKASEGMTEELAYDKLKDYRKQDIYNQLDIVDKKADTSSLNDLAIQYFKQKEKEADREKGYAEDEKTFKTFKNIDKERSLYRNSWQQWILSNSKLSQIKEDQVVDFLYELKNGQTNKRKYSDKTISNVLALAKSILKHTNHNINSPFSFQQEKNQQSFKKGIKKRKRYLKKHEVRKLLDYLEKHSSMQNYVMALTSLTTGARPNTVLFIKIEHIIFKDKKIKLYDFKRKHYYCLSISDKLFNKLIEISKGRDPREFVFTTSFTKGKTKMSEYPSSIKKVLDKLFNVNLYPGQERIVPYSFRHTLANLMLHVYKLDIYEVSTMLNHKTIETTINHYIEKDDEAIKSKVNIFADDI